MTTDVITYFYCIRFFVAPVRCIGFAWISLSFSSMRCVVKLQLDLVDGDGHIAGSLTISVIALSAMQSILSDP